MTAHANTLTVAMNGRGNGPQGSAEVRKRDELDWLLKQPFAEGVRGRIDRAFLWALFDLGLTVAQIARYFSTDPVKVQACLAAVSEHRRGDARERRPLGLPMSSGTRAMAPH